MWCGSDDDALAQVEELGERHTKTHEKKPPEAAARRLMYDIYEARGELDKIDFK